MSNKSNLKNILKQTSENGFINIKTLEGFVFCGEGDYYITPSGTLEAVNQNYKFEVFGYMVKESVSRFDSDLKIDKITEDARRYF